jgi:hypothetical protein
MTARGWARVGLYGGLLLSLAGNEAHVWGDGYPGWGPAIASVIWPALLFVALEIVLHMGAGQVWTKLVGLGLPAAVSGAVSYWHLSSVLHTWNYGLLSWFGPLAVDGLMVMSTVVLARSAAVPAPTLPRTPRRVYAGPEPLAFPEPKPMPVPEQPAPEVHPVTPPQPSPPEHVRPAKPAGPERRPQGVHVRDGRELRGPELEADAVALVRTRGLSNADLAVRYDPPLKSRKAEEFGAKARRPANGHVPQVRIP